jgi:hypothetical protein
MKKDTFPSAPSLSNPFTMDIDVDKPAAITSTEELFLKNTFKDEKTLHNLKFILKDILSGDNSVAKKEEYAYLNFTQIKLALDWLIQNDMDDDLKSLLISDPWRLNFKDKPPTPEEFLGPKYIGSMSEFLWEPMKNQFIEFLDPLKPYRSGIWNTSIGSGKKFTLDTKLLESKKKWFYMGDAKIGQNILTPYGQSKIISLQPHKAEPIYKIKLSDGRTCRCGLDHLWTVSWEKDINGNKIWKTVDTKFLIENKYKYEIPTQETKDNLNSATQESFNPYYS